MQTNQLTNLKISPDCLLFLISDTKPQESVWLTLAETRSGERFCQLIQLPVLFLVLWYYYTHLQLTTKGACILQGFRHGVHVIVRSAREKEDTEVIP